MREKDTSALAGFHVGRLSWSNWNHQCWFLWREEKRKAGRKTLLARREATTNSTHIWRMAPGGIETGPH